MIVVRRSCIQFTPFLCATLWLSSECLALLLLVRRLPWLNFIASFGICFTRSMPCYHFCRTVKRNRIFNLLALLKIMACMPESMIVDKKEKTIPFHYDNPLRSFKCASYDLKWMDEVNENYLGQPLHLINSMRVTMIPFIVSIHTPISK